MLAEGRYVYQESVVSKIRREFGAEWSYRKVRHSLRDVPATIETADQSMLPVVETIMGPRGLTRDWKILDFGSGVGRHTREFRAAGYDTVGVDRPYPGLAEDLASLPDGGEHIYVAAEGGDFPFADSTFDFCFSTSVFEHVMEYDKPISEIARVLKPGAWTLHVFPARWRPVEPHIFTPFGGRFQHEALVKLWARLGIRNAFQKGMSPEETARRNIEYCATGINYPTKPEIEASFRRHFPVVEFIEGEFIGATAGVSRASKLAARLLTVPGVEGAYRGLHTRAVLSRR